VAVIPENNLLLRSSQEVPNASVGTAASYLADDIHQSVSNFCLVHGVNIQ